jgi:hypothetical protein
MFKWKFLALLVEGWWWLCAQCKRVL